MENLCLFCAYIITDNNNCDNREIHKKLFILHKLLQIPLQTSCKYINSDEIHLCDSCQLIYAEGCEVVNEVEKLQLKLQTLQATVQNLILSCHNSDQDGCTGSASLRISVRNDINQNLKSSALQTNYSELRTSFGDQESSQSNQSHFIGKSQVSPGIVVDFVPQTCSESGVEDNGDDVLILDEVFPSSSQMPKRNCLSQPGATMQIDGTQRRPPPSLLSISPQPNIISPLEEYEIIWTGEIEWCFAHINNEYIAPRVGFTYCNIISAKSQIPFLNFTKWSSKLTLQLVKKEAFKYLGNTISLSAKKLEFRPTPGEQTSNLISIMKNGFVGCIVQRTDRSVFKYNLTLVHYHFHLGKHIFVGYIPLDHDKILSEMKTIFQQRPEISANQPPQLNQDMNQG